MKKMLLPFRNLSPELRTALNFTAIQGFFWFAWAFGCYGTVYLQNNNFPASGIGSLNAISSTVAIFAMMIWGMISDRINSIKRTLLFALITSALFYSIVPFLPVGTPYSVIIFFIYYPFVNIFRCSLSTLLDNITVRTCAEKRVNYGIVRAFGSFTFTVGSFIIVALIPQVGVGASFWMSGLLMIPTILSLFFAHDPKRMTNAGDKKQKISLRPLLKNYYYVTFMVFTAILYVGLSAEASFITYFMEDAGVSNSNYGTLLAIRALMEIPLLIIIIKLRARFRLKYLIMIACVLMATECLLLSFFAASLGGILACGALFGLGNGMFLGTVSFYLYKLAPDHLKASAQTVYAAVSSISGIVGNLAGGFAYELFGSRAFYLILGVIILTGTGFFALSLFLKRGLTNPGDVKG